MTTTVLSIGSNLGDRLFPAALSGTSASVLGNPDQPHSYTYIPDIGEGLAALGEHPDAPGQVWHLPNDPNTQTTRQLVDDARRGLDSATAQLAFWLTASLLIGAFCASLAATEGGALRDGTWIRKPNR